VRLDHLLFQGELMLFGYFALTLLHTRATSELKKEMEVFFPFSLVAALVINI